MYRLLAILLVALPQPTSAGEVPLTWKPPTQNDDGTPLTDLASYEIWHGCDQSGSYDTVEIVLAPATSHTVLNLPDVGTCYFAAKATNTSGISSVFSSEATKLMGQLALPGLVTDTVITWAESTSIYSLPETNFTGTPVIAGNWSVPGQSLTINFEITPRSWPVNDVRIISKATSTAEQEHWFMVSMTGNNHVLRFRLKTAGTTHTLFGSMSIPLNTKTVGRVTYDGSAMLIYINGQLDAQRSKTGDMDTSSAQVWVGGNPTDNYGAFDGLISIMVK